MEKITVLMSTYNGEKYLRQQIDSILVQKDCLVELIVRDDGSMDGTCEILEEYQSENKLKWYSGKNLGAAKSFYEMMLSESDSEYFAFADQDDIWDDDKLSVAIEMLKPAKDEVALYYSNARLIDETGSNIGINTYKIMQETNFEGFVCSGGALGCTMVINKKLHDIVQTGDMPDKIIMHDNYFTCLCFALNGKVIYDHAAHMSYRQHNSNVIGVPVNFAQAIKFRLETLLTPKKVSIAEQARDIIDRFSSHIERENKEYLEHIANYKASFITRLRLALHPRTKYVSWKSSVYIRLGLFLGKR